MIHPEGHVEKPKSEFGSRELECPDGQFSAGFNQWQYKNIRI